MAVEETFWHLDENKISDESIIRVRLGDNDEIGKRGLVSVKYRNFED